MASRAKADSGPGPDRLGRGWMEVGWLVAIAACAAPPGGGSGADAGPGGTGDASGAPADAGDPCAACVDGAACDAGADVACACPAGFTGDGRVDGSGCADADECADPGRHDCDDFACVNEPGGYHCTGYLATSPDQAWLARVDPGSHRFADVVPLRSSRPDLISLVALAREPGSGAVLAVARYADARTLAEVDPESGRVTDRGTLPDRFASITFGRDGTLYGVTGDGAVVPETLYRIDPTTASITLVGALGNGRDGECIAFDPDRDALMHWSGNAVSMVERVDPATPGEPIPLIDNAIHTEVYACAHVGDGFRVADRRGYVYAVGADGVATASDRGGLPEGVRGLIDARMVAPHTVRPRQGGRAGDTPVTLRGLGLTGATAVFFGDQPATFRVVDDATIDAVAPPASGPGPVDVRVTTSAASGWREAVWTAGYRYE